MSAKITRDDTRMIEVARGEFVHVRGEAKELKIVGEIRHHDGRRMWKIDEFRGKRVLILELVE